MVWLSVAACGWLLFSGAVSIYLVLDAAGFAPGCGSGGDPNSCPQGASGASVVVLLAACGVVIIGSTTLLIAWILGPAPSHRLGRWRLIAAGAALPLLLYGALVLAVQVDQRVLPDNWLRSVVPLLCMIAAVAAWTSVLRRLAAE
jgi:hypothetical protein